MIRRLAISWLAGVMTLAAAEPSDLLRFINGDQLHGSFQGIKDGPRAIWKRDDLGAPVEFKTDELRHIVLHGGQPVKPLSTLSHLALVNGDRIPGTISAMDAEWIILETPYAGVLKIPREQVAMFAPSPLGGRLHYHGPFSENDWKMVESGSRAPRPRTLPEPQEDPRFVNGQWAFSGSAWYWPSKASGVALVRENVMPDRAILRFDVAWKNRLSFAIGFHSDFQKPKVKEGDEKEGEAPIVRNAFAPGDSAVLPLLFGNSYVLQMFSTHMMLFRTNSEGGPPERVQISGNSVRLGETGKATVEIRANRLTGDITLFINDEFSAQWNEGPKSPEEKGGEYAGKGAGFGFVVQTEDSPVRISDVMVAEWNGMPDSARSLQVDEQDIVLLTNGTDRFSGKVGTFEDGKINMEGKYGKFQFQVEDIAEIRFARDRLAKKKEEVPSGGNLVVKLSPLGQITGRPLSGNGSFIKLLSPVFGEMNFNLESAVMLDFQQTTNIIDDWDAEF